MLTSGLSLLKLSRFGDPHLIATVGQGLLGSLQRSKQRLVRAPLRHAKAAGRAHARLAGQEEVIRGDSGANHVAPVRGLLRIEHGEGEGKPTAAEAGHDGRLLGGQARYGLQDRVAGIVAEKIVDGLEAVDVETTDGAAVLRVQLLALGPSMRRTPGD